MSWLKKMLRYSQPRLVMRRVGQTVNSEESVAIVAKHARENTSTNFVEVLCALLKTTSEKDR